MTMKKANKPAKPAILPANKQDPTGVDRLERGAMRDFSKRLRKIGKGYIELLNRIPSEPAVNQRYTFRLDQTLLSMLLQNGESLVDDILLQGGELNLWFWQDYVSTAYQRGTAQEFSNLSQQSPAYAADRESIENILLSEAYQSRLILVRAREFEEMKGLSNQIKADLSRVLTDGIGRGLNPREVARNITAQTDIERSRANRIARTEITTALRRARWDEHDQAKDDLGLNVMLLHMSALSPTTRRTHALRHGHLYTSDEVREWYSINGNAINCKCTQVTVLVDEKGVPLNSSVIDIAKKEFAQTWGKRMATNKSHHCCKHAA
ncbi:phage minor head protein [Cronobacter sakazakii]|uniref:phage minor head protein n=1 Tax=Cronobacter sakazakii TaxID=28141 RepID=UPI0021B63AAC|nr:phage minor head protein [Cronobacter sakazakii]MDZ7554468.1 phage minor head protein [Cronobacter sakazakii]